MEGGQFKPTGLDLDVLARNFTLVLRGEGVKNGDSKKQRERPIKGLLGLAAVIKKRATTRPDTVNVITFGTMVLMFGNDEGKKSLTDQGISWLACERHDGLSV
jgi:hypothetical protein